MKMSTSVLVAAIVVAGAVSARPSRGGDTIEERVGELETRATRLDAAVLRLAGAPAASMKFDALRDPRKAEPDSGASVRVKLAHGLWEMAYAKAGMAAEFFKLSEATLPKADPVSYLEIQQQVEKYRDALVMHIDRTLRAQKDYEEAGGK